MKERSHTLPRLGVLGPIFAHPATFPPSLLLLFLPPLKVTEVYLEDLRGFCAFLEADLALSCFVDSMVKRGESMA